MKARLMFDDRDFSVARDPQFGEPDLIQDLELDTLWNAMGLGDEVVRESARSAMLSGLTSVEQIRYRQDVLADCLGQPSVVREIYGLAVRAIAEERKIYRASFFSRSSEALLGRSITALELFVRILRQLRTLTEEHSAQFYSAGFTRFFDTLRRELDDDYFEEIAQHMRQLRFRDGLLGSASLGESSQGIGYVLHTPRQRNRGSVLLRQPPVRKPAYSHTIARDDLSGAQALGELRDRVLGLVANALAQSADHIAAFFAALRAELGFYVGCLNLHEQFAARQQPQCRPDPDPMGTSTFSARNLYDPCLSLRTAEPVLGNDLDAAGKPLVIITGANQGGKSTFLRSLGVAQLMMQAGMNVGAESFSATVVRGVFTHYKREEDATMTSGKFDEELSRMSGIAKAIGTNSLLICNESFAATNEREGSEIASEVVRAMNDAGNTVVFVTHLYEFADRFYRDRADTTLFLRAGRDIDGQRPFHITEGRPLPTSYGEDLYRRTFEVPPASPAAASGDVSADHGGARA